MQSLKRLFFNFWIICLCEVCDSTRNDQTTANWLPIIYSTTIHIILTFYWEYDTHNCTLSNAYGSQGPICLQVIHICYILDILKTRIRVFFVIFCSSPLSFSKQGWINPGLPKKDLEEGVNRSQKSASVSKSATYGDKQNLSRWWRIYFESGRDHLFIWVCCTDPFLIQKTSSIVFYLIRPRE